jgi:putative SOS response-associated peptidase YedK
MGQCCGDDAQKKLDAKINQPYAIALSNDDFMALTGLWENWKSPADEWVRSFTIITTTPHEPSADIHNRMSVILPRTVWATWLSEEVTDMDALKTLLAPNPAEEKCCVAGRPAR